MNLSSTPQTDLSWDRFAALWMCNDRPQRGLRARLPLALLRAGRFFRWLN